MRERIGELRESEAGNVFELVSVDGDWRMVRRVGDGTRHFKPDPEPYRWHREQWLGLPRFAAPIGTRPATP
jgi:hypothetical protein